MLLILLIGALFHGGIAQNVCQWTVPNDDSARNMFLDLHNMYRAYVARGEAYHKDGRLKGSSILFELKYDCHLELMSMTVTNDCNRSSHLPSASINSFEIENEPYALNEHELIWTAIESWYQPVLSVSVRSVPPYHFTLASFAKMLYHKSLKVGCSYKLCPSTPTSPSTNLVACVYSAVPDLRSRIYYADGHGCVDDAGCSDVIANSTCIKEGPNHGLCSQGTAPAAPMAIKSMEELTASSLTSQHGLVH